MKQELDDKLVNTFPLLYRNRHKNMRSSCMAQGFSHDEGWYNLLFELSAKLEALIQKQVVESDPSICECGCNVECHDDTNKCTNVFFTRDGKDYKCLCENFHVACAAADQVKEKFGSLRFYMSNATEEMRDLVREAEEKSGSMCEICGEFGTMRSGGWIRCLCDQHAKEMNRS